MASSQDLIQQLRAKGLSNAAIARAVGRDSSLIGQIAKGAKPGTNLQGSLAELAQKGQVSTPPMRRTTSSGTLAKVRGRGGGESIVPVAPAGQRVQTISRSTQQPTPLDKPAPQGARNRLTYQHNTHYSGREQHRVTVPKANQAANRKEGSGILQTAIARAAAAGKRISGTVWAEVRRKDGARDKIPVRLGGHGGYSAQDVRDAVDASRGGAFGWVDTQVRNRYPEFEGNFVVVGIDLDVW